jgi:cyclophilin family peptidyl-prolyl cis-trans isomerase
VKGFLVQFGITYNKELKNQPPIQDDPQNDPKIAFEKGFISFAGSGPNSRTSQLFIAYAPSSGFGRELWETPVGKVVEGMEHVEAFYSYGDMPPWGKGPVQGKIHSGPEYIEENFPLTDKFDVCRVERLGKEAKNVAETQVQQPTKSMSNLRDQEQKVANPTEIEAGTGEVIGVSFTSLIGGLGVVALILVVVKLLLPSGKSRNKKS